ncbi:MAG: PilZ domain-containing protein [Terracidiphilus sp.]
METRTNQGDGTDCVHGHELQSEPCHAPDRRAHTRIEINAAAALQLLGQDLTLPGRIADLSQQGCRVQLSKQFPAGTRMRVEVTFRVNGISFRRGGLTEWSDGWSQMGIRFSPVPASRAAILSEVIAEVQAEELARQAQQVAQVHRWQASLPDAKDEVAIQYEDASQPEQAPSLFAEQARKQIHQVPDLPRVRHAQQLHHRQLADGFMRPERRAHPRHMVDASASLIPVPGGSKLSGRILDLSLEGCRVRTDARSSLGIFSRVETEFRLEGLPFRLGGSVQAIHDRCLVGVHFLEMSDRKRAQIPQLIAEFDAHASGEEVAGNRIDGPSTHKSMHPETMA